MIQTVKDLKKILETMNDELILAWEFHDEPELKPLLNLLETKGVSWSVDSVEQRFGFLMLQSHFGEEQ